MRIDAHHHFWRYDPAEYAWIDDSMPSLRRDFLPGDLREQIDGVGVDGVISVQARQSLAETRWLCELAAENSFIQGVVGWAPLASPDLRAQLATLGDCPKLKSVRHVVQDEPDDRFLLRDDFNRGVGTLVEFGLTYDLLIFERQLPAAIEFVDRHPDLTIVLDHLAKPRAREHQLEPWATNIRSLAQRENVYCKLSGLVTEADWQHWSHESLAPYWDVIVAAFGPQRLMFGSDWPVCLLASDYCTWYEVCCRFTSVLSPTEQQRIFGGTAIEAYRLATND